MPETSDRPTAPEKPARKPGLLDRVGMFDSRFAFVRGLSIVTLLSSVVVGYFQYLNAYQEKVSNQAKEDMKSATDTLDEISTAFSDALALQNLVYASFAAAVRSKSDASATALGTRNAGDVSKAYERARTDLREKIDVLTQKAEVYIDWASDIDRDPAGKRNVEGDPLSRSLLHLYRFDCASDDNFPKFGNVNASPGQPHSDVPDEAFCASDRKQVINDQTPPPNAFIRICSGDPKDNALRIYWYSAKHHVLTMHYCFENLHDRLEGARQWASQSDRDAGKEKELVAQADQMTDAIDGLARRLNSFDSLALYQLERIRVKYRPAGFVCTVPLVRNLFARKCLPLRTTTELVPRDIRTAATPAQPRDQPVMTKRYPSESR